MTKKVINHDDCSFFNNSPKLVIKDGEEGKKDSEEGLVLNILLFDQKVVKLKGSTSFFRLEDKKEALSVLLTDSVFADLQLSPKLENLRAKREFGQNFDIEIAKLSYLEKEVKNYQKCKNSLGLEKDFSPEN